MVRKDERPVRVRRNDALRGGLEQRSQRAIVFLVATRLERILGLRRSVKSRSSPVSRVTLPVGVAIGASPALDPRHRSVGPHDPVTCSPTNPWLSTS